MKFDSSLSDYKNLSAWHEHHFDNLEKRTSFAELNAEERSWLRGLNIQLTQIEDQYFTILKAKEIDLKARVLNPDDWMQDFNLCFDIVFYLRKDDIEYDEWDDNILMKIFEHSFYSEASESDWGFGATNINHCEFLDIYEGEHHCYLFHQLCDHVGLDWQDLFRIGEISVEIKIDEQSGYLPVCDLLSKSEPSI